MKIESMNGSQTFFIFMMCICLFIKYNAIEVSFQLNRLIVWLEKIKDKMEKEMKEMEKDE